MKNAFKFGFLGLLVSVAFAACNSNTTSEEADAQQSVDSLVTEMQQELDSAADSIDSIGEEVIDSLDSMAN